MKIIIGDCLAYNVATAKIHTSSTISILQVLADANNGEKVNMCLDYGDIVGKLNHKQIQKEAKRQKSIRRLQKMRF